MRTFFTVSASLCALLPLTNTALAQTDTAPGAAPLERVVVEGQLDDYKTPSPASTATKTDTPVLLTPQSLQTIPRAVLQDQGATSIADAIRNVSGVGLDFGFNGSDLPLMLLRGFPTVSMSARGPMAGSAPFYSDGTLVQGVPINIANTESVEVIKGPASVLYGRGEPGGMVNVVTRRAQSAPSVSAEATVGSFDTQRGLLEATGALSADQTWLGRAAVSYAKSVASRRLVTNRLGAVSGELAWQPNSQSRVSLKLDASDQEYRNDYGVPALGNRPAVPGRDIPEDAQYNDAPELSTNRTQTLQLDGAHQFNSNWQLKAHALLGTSRAAQLDITPYRLDLATFEDCLATTGQLCRYYFSARPDLKSRTTQANVDLIGKLATGSVQHTVLVGVDAYRFQADATSFFEFQPAIDIRNPVYGLSTPLNRDPALGMPEQTRSRWTGIYVQDQMDLGRGVHLSAALRYERNSARYGSPDTAPVKDSYTTPRLGAVWNFVPQQSVYAQYQDSVAANNGRNLRGEALPAERARQIEAGYKFESRDGKLAATLALYQLTKRNISNYAPSTDADFLGQFDTSTVGAARSQGVEVDVSGQLSKRLAVIASYAYTATEVTEDLLYQGAKLPNAPRHSASVWARWQFDTAFSAGLGVFGQSQRQGDQANTFQLPGYARVDAMAAYKFKLGQTSAQLQLNLNNLFDRLYYTGSHALVQDWTAVGAKRNAQLTLRVNQ
jgi:iron complex outermembrane recepter protein